LITTRSYATDLQAAKAIAGSRRTNLLA